MNEPDLYSPHRPAMIDKMLELAQALAGEPVSVSFNVDGKRVCCDVQGSESYHLYAASSRSTASEAWEACIQQMRDA